MKQQKNSGAKAGTTKKKGDDSVENKTDIDELQKEAEKKNSKKPGSQSNSSDRHNNGRGGGK